MPLPFLKLNPLLKEPLCSHLIFNLMVFSHFLLQFLKVDKVRNIFLVNHISQKINEKNVCIFYPVIFIILEMLTIFFTNIFVETIH